MRLLSAQSLMVNFLPRCSLSYKEEKGELASPKLMTRDKRVHHAWPRGAPGFRMVALGNCHAREQLYVVPDLSLT